MSIEHLPVPLIATGDNSGKVIVHRDGEPPQALQAHTDTVSGLSFCPTNPDLLASASWNKAVIVWDINGNMKSKKTLHCSTCPNGVSWSCDGQYIAAACHDKKCYIFDAHNDYKQLCVLEGHTGSVMCIAFHPQNPAVCATASWDGTVRVWQLSSGSQGELRAWLLWLLSAGSQPPKSLKVLQHGGVVPSCCWLPDGKHLVSGGYDCDVRLWNIEGGSEAAKFEGHRFGLFSVAVSPDGRMIASASNDETCRIWEAKSGGKQLQVLNHPHAVCDVSFASDGLHVVTGCVDGKIRVWSIAVGKVVAELGGHEGSICCLALPPTNCQAGATDAVSNTGRQERRGRNDED